MRRRVAVIGLDGATWTILRPMLDAGAMPALASLLGRAAVGTLRSTIPPYTPPAWTSAVTGVNPGRHGIFGFIQGRAEPGLAHWGLVRAPAIWDHLEPSGARIGLFHLPLTYPPPAVNGWSVGAVWMPTGRRIAGFTHPRSIESLIRQVAPDYAPVSGVELFEDWRDPSLAGRIGETMRERKNVLALLLEREPVDVVWAVLEAPDRLQHAYYKYLDPAEPMAGRPEAAPVRRTVTDAFRRVDEIVGLLDDYVGPDGVALVCSDHGATGWHGYVLGNALLGEAGLLRLRPSGRLARRLGAGALGPAARRLLPGRVTYRARRRVQEMLDWSHTLAYAARLGSQGFSVNLAGREPHGAVSLGDAAMAEERLRAVLEAARTPSGQPLFPAIHRREDVYWGPAAQDAPDLIVEAEGWRWEVSDSIAGRGRFQVTADLPLGCHHPDGVMALRAPGVIPSTDARAGICDVLPTLLHAAGEPVPEGLDGRARSDLLEATRPPVVTTPSVPHPEEMTEPSPYSPEEEELITRYLTDLGYIG